MGKIPEFYTDDEELLIDHPYVTGGDDKERDNDGVKVMKVSPLLNPDGLIKKPPVEGAIQIGGREDQEEG